MGGGEGRGCRRRRGVAAPARPPPPRGRIKRPMQCGSGDAHAARAVAGPRPRCGAMLSVAASGCRVAGAPHEAVPAHRQPLSARSVVRGGGDLLEHKELAALDDLLGGLPVLNHAPPHLRGSGGGGGGGGVSKPSVALSCRLVHIAISAVCSCGVATGIAFAHTCKPTCCWPIPASHSSPLQQEAQQSRHPPRTSESSSGSATPTMRSVNSEGTTTGFSSVPKGASSLPAEGWVGGRRGVGGPDVEGERAAPPAPHWQRVQAVYGRPLRCPAAAQPAACPCCRQLPAGGPPLLRTRAGCSAARV